MDETVLLGPLGRIRHRQIGLARLDPSDRNPERPHRLLSVERRGDNLQVIGILRQESVDIRFVEGIRSQVEPLLLGFGHVIEVIGRFDHMRR